MKTTVKICGITTMEDALAAVNAGADALGFVFSPSPRQVSAEVVRGIVDQLPPFISTVGVFVDEPLPIVLDAIKRSGISMVQLQGNESNEYCQQIDKPVIKGFRVAAEVDVDLINSYQVSAYLFDTYIEGRDGGTGQRFDWDLLRRSHFSRPVIVAGGLNANNVRHLMEALNPDGVDVSSGVSATASTKDSVKMHAFVSAVEKAGQEQGLEKIEFGKIDILREAFHDRPLEEVNGKQFLINSLTEQVPATPARLLHVAAQRVCEAADLSPGLKLVGEEDKGGVLLAAVSLLSGLPFGIARWYPSGLEGQVKVGFDCEYISGELYLNGVEPGDRVVIVDDLISTGGTLIGLIEAVRRAGAHVEQIICVAEKLDYAGVERVRNVTGLEVKTLVRVRVSGATSSVVDVAY
jgi:phosphoribosylanthranilate isomerase/adenine/guanine phosphoribosyltransferase-like PRPP-binding protein